MSGPDLDTGIGAPADLHGAETIGQSMSEIIDDRLVHMKAIGGGARLAHIAHLGHDGSIQSRVEVGIGEHEKRGVAPELHGQPEELLGRVGHQALADLGRTGEGQLAGARIGEQGSDRLA